MNCILFYGSSTMPLQKHGGAFRIASELRKHDYKVQCIDICAFLYINEIDKLKTVLDNIVSEDTYWIGFSTTFFEFEILDQINEFISYLKITYKNVKIISGGWTRHKKHFDFKLIDHVFKNYSDTEIVEYTDICSKRNSKKNLKYISRIIQGSEYLKFSESQILYDQNDIVHPLDALPLEISRGCIFKCKFCAFPLNGKTKGEWIKKSNVLADELNRNYEKYGITCYSFLDDTYNDSLDKLKHFNDDVYSKLNFKIQFTTYLRLDLIMRIPEMIPLLKNSGLRSAMFGIETLNHSSGKIIGKGVNPQEQIDFLIDLKKNDFKNILISSGFIFGLPADNVDTIDELENFLFSDRNPLDSWWIHPLKLFPIDTSNSNYFSEFDLNYQNYGYEITENGWVNNKTKLSSQFCTEKVETLLNKSKLSSKYKLGGFLYNYIRRLGVSEQDLMNKSRKEIYVIYDLKNKLKNECLDYCNKLLIS